MTTDPADCRRILLPVSDASFLYQSEGLPVSQEALFLCRFTLRLAKNLKQGMDLGCGCGLLAIIMALEHRTVHFHALDIQEHLIEIAQKNCRRNGVGNRVECSVEDIRSIHSKYAQNSVDLVIANPPFRKNDTGKVSPNVSRSLACHEISVSMKDYTFAASIVLRSGGYFATVTIPDRFLELTAEMIRRRLTPTTVQFIHHHRGDAANAVLVLGRKNSRASMEVMTPIIVESETD